MTWPAGKVVEACWGEPGRSRRHHRRWGGWSGAAQGRLHVQKETDLLEEHLDIHHVVVVLLDLDRGLQWVGIHCGTGSGPTPATCHHTRRTSGVPSRQTHSGRRQPCSQSYLLRASWCWEQAWSLKSFHSCWFFFTMNGDLMPISATALSALLAMMNVKQSKQRFGPYHENVLPTIL